MLTKLRLEHAHYANSSQYITSILHSILHSIFLSEEPFIILLKRGFPIIFLKP